MIKKLSLCAILIFVLLLIGNMSIQVKAQTLYRYDQHATAYTSKPGDLTASGLVPKVGHVAVHPIISGSNTPILPFGTIIYILEVRDTQGNYISDMIAHPNAGDEMYAFQVQDMGDKSRLYSTYWIDIYWGLTSPEMEQSARDFGIKIVDYKYFK